MIKEGKICILKDMQAKEIGKTSSYPAKVHLAMMDGWASALPSCSPNYPQELVDLGPGNSLCFSGKELEVHHPPNDSASMNVVHLTHRLLCYVM